MRSADFLLWPRLAPMGRRSAPDAPVLLARLLPRYRIRAEVIGNENTMVGRIRESWCLAECRQLEDGTIIGVGPMVFTWALYVGLSMSSYDRRYCYEGFSSAVIAARTWDGSGDPPGSWIKEKPSDMVGPGATT